MSKKPVKRKTSGKNIAEKEPLFTRIRKFGARETLSWTWQTYIWPHIWSVVAWVAVMLTGISASALAWVSQVDWVFKFPAILFTLCCVLWAINLVRAGRWPRLSIGRGTPAAIEEEPTKPEKEQKPFLLKYATSGIEVGLLREDGQLGHFEVVKCLLINARPERVDDFEMFLSGETRDLNATHPARMPIEKVYLTTRRGVKHLNQGGQEEFVILSRPLRNPSAAFWGDYKFIPEADRIPVSDDYQHHIEIHISSPTTQPYLARLLIITASREKRHIFPIELVTAKWVWNG